MLNHQLFKMLEKSRWNLHTGIPWARFEKHRLTEEQARTIKMNAVSVWAALPAAEDILPGNHHENEFSAFMAGWFYDEQQHALVLIDYLQRFWPEHVPSEEELNEARFTMVPASPLESLMRHFCSEVRLAQWYKCAAQWHTEPVIRHIYQTISRDEARHAGTYLKFMKRAVTQFGDDARIAFSKMGALVANGGRCSHITYPEVTLLLSGEDSTSVDHGWMEEWLSQKIQFNARWENKVTHAILSNLSSLLEAKFSSPMELTKYRKTLIAASYNQGGFY